MITPQTIEQIKSRIDIIDVVGEYVKLKKRGANYLGLCPFHNEKTPSFTVSPSKEIYKCFGCGKSGNTITFLMEHDKLSYTEALRWLANRYNIEIEETESTPEQTQARLTSDSLYIINNFSQKFFDDKLFNSEEGQNIALSYLKERGFRNEIIKKFQVGYNPSQRNELAKALLQNQFSEELLSKTGLVIKRNDDWVDNYRNRIIFPIHNNTGKIIGFGARVIGKADNAPKYINTPENEIYVKSKVLYGIYFARTVIDKLDECLLVEGYTDVISLHQAGIENVVASGGTSLTIDQLRLIKKYTNNLTIIYDGDAAGVKAALRGLDMALEEGLNVRLVLIPDNEDPDSYVLKVGTTAFQKFVAENKKDFILFQLEVMLKEAGNDVTKKSEAINQIAFTLSKITNPKDIYKRQEYIKECSRLSGISESGLIRIINQHIFEKIEKGEKIYPSIDEKKIFNNASSKETEPPLDEAIHLLLESQFQERELIKRLIEYGYKKWDENNLIYEVIFKVLDEYHLKNEQLIKIVDIYKNLIELYGEVHSESILYTDDKELNMFIAGLLAFPYELFDWGKRLEGYSIKLDQDITKVIDSAIAYYKLRKLKVMYAQLEDELQQQQNNAEEYIITQKIYISLKDYERDITKQLGTVIIK